MEMSYFKWLYNIPSYVHTLIFKIHTPNDGHLGCFNIFILPKQSLLTLFVDIFAYIYEYLSEVNP